VVTQSTGQLNAVFGALADPDGNGWVAQERPPNE